MWAETNLISKPLYFRKSGKLLKLSENVYFTGVYVKRPTVTEAAPKNDCHYLEYNDT